jgi:hypothetical protein
MKAKTQPNTDHQLREAVMTQLDWEPEAPGAGIGVSAAGRRGGLSGAHRRIHRRGDPVLLLSAANQS